MHFINKISAVIDEFSIVRDDQYTSSAVSNAPQQLCHFPHMLPVKTTCRLIENQNRTLPHERSCKKNALLLSARKRCRVSLRKCRKIKLFQKLFGSSDGFGSFLFVQQNFFQHSRGIELIIRILTDENISFFVCG